MANRISISINFKLRCNCGKKFPKGTKFWTIINQVLEECTICCSDCKRNIIYWDGVIKYGGRTINYTENTVNEHRKILESQLLKIAVQKQMNKNKEDMTEKIDAKLKLLREENQKAKMKQETVAQVQQQDRAQLIRKLEKNTEERVSEQLANLPRSSQENEKLQLLKDLLRKSE